MDLAKVLADLRAAGTSEAKVTFEGDKITSLHVVLGHRAHVTAPAGFVGKNGEPVNLDEGMGQLEVDPLEAAEAAGDALAARNFSKKPVDAG